MYKDPNFSVSIHSINNFFLLNSYYFTHTHIAVKVVWALCFYNALYNLHMKFDSDQFYSISLIDVSTIFIVLYTILQQDMSVYFKSEKLWLKDAFDVVHVNLLWSFFLLPSLNISWNYLAYTHIFVVLMALRVFKLIKSYIELIGFVSDEFHWKPVGWLLYSVSSILSIFCEWWRQNLG